MPRTATLTVELPVEMIDEIRARVASGAYPDESAVVLEGLFALGGEDETAQLDDAAVARWVEDDVLPTYDRMKVDPQELITMDEARARLRMLGLSRKRA
jgi:antitoxin ParD1/3/4